MDATLTTNLVTVACEGRPELALTLFAPESGTTTSSTSLDEVFDKVERAKQEWEATVDTLTELVCLVDERGCVIRANRTLEQWQLGSVTRVRGINLHALLHPDCSNLFCTISHSLQQIGHVDAENVKPVEIYDPFLGRHVQILARPIISAKANLPRAVVVVLRDITAQKQNEAALRRSLMRLEAMNAMQRAILAAQTPEDIVFAALTRIQPLLPIRQARLILFSAQGQDCLMFTADASSESSLRPFCSSPGASPQLGSSRRLTDFLAVDDLAQLGNLSPLEQQLLTEGVRSYTNIPLQSDTGPLGALLLGSGRSIPFDSEQLEVAREIGTMLAIATRQAQLYRRLQRTNVELQQALRSKEELLQNVSHELRTPLSLIYGYTTLLDNDELGELAPDQKQAIRVMLHNEERLRFMVDRLVMLRSLDTDSLQRLPRQLLEWLPRQVWRWQEKVALDTRNIQIQLELPASLPVLYFDQEAIQQVIDNLLDNAVKFSLPNTDILVRAYLQNETVIIAVHDHGIGLAPQSLTQVFENFYQVDGGRTRQYGGMGIGLALCRTVVEAHGGRIWGESAGDGHGSTFSVALPVNVAPPTGDFPDTAA